MGLGLLVWALTAAAEAGTPRDSLVSATVAGIALMVLFLWLEQRRGDDALMPFGLFGTCRPSPASVC